MRRARNSREKDIRGIPRCAPRQENGHLDEFLANDITTWPDARYMNLKGSYHYALDSTPFFPFSGGTGCIYMVL